MHSLCFCMRILWLNVLSAQFMSLSYVLWLARPVCGTIFHFMNISQSVYPVYCWWVVSRFASDLPIAPACRLFNVFPNTYNIYLEPQGKKEGSFCKFTSIPIPLPTLPMCLHWLTYLARFQGVVCKNSFPHSSQPSLPTANAWIPFLETLSFPTVEMQVHYGEGMFFWAFCVICPPGRRKEQSFSWELTQMRNPVALDIWGTRFFI